MNILLHLLFVELLEEINFVNGIKHYDLVSIGLHNVSKQAQNQLLCVTWLRCNETIYTMLISTCIRLLYHPWLFT